MLSEIYEKLKIEGEIDPEFVRKAIYDESTWALAWKYPGIVGSSRESTPPVVKDVLDVLEMWEMLEHSYNRLQAADREKVRLKQNHLDTMSASTVSMVIMRLSIWPPPWF